jgi:hypothetical protein
VYRPLVGVLSKPPVRSAAVPAQAAASDWEFAEDWRYPDMLAAGLRDEPSAPVTEAVQQ